MCVLTEYFCRTEVSINSLSDSMEEIKEIRKEQDAIKWDFLDNNNLA